MQKWVHICFYIRFTNSENIARKLQFLHYLKLQQLHPTFQRNLSKPQEDYEVGLQLTKLISFLLLTQAAKLASLSENGEFLMNTNVVWLMTLMVWKLIGLTYSGNYEDFDKRKKIAEEEGKRQVFSVVINCLGE